jgi:hypothetical protein
VHAGEHPNFGFERTNAFRVTTVGANAALEDGLAVGFVLEVFVLR